MKTIRKCTNCEMDFTIDAWRLNDPTRKCDYCSKKCYGLANRGDKSPHWKGGNSTTATEGLICLECGKSFTGPRAKKTCSKTCQYNYVSWKTKRNADGRWRGSRSFRLWRKEVLGLYKFCVMCGSKDDIQADHIIPVFKDPSLALVVSNGQPICKSCHHKKTAIDKKWGFD